MKISESYLKNEEPCCEDDQQNLPEEHPKETLRLSGKNDREYVLDLKDKKYELVDISDCTFDHVTIINAEVYLLRINNCELRYINIMNSTGLNWSIFGGTVGIISIKKGICGGDLYVTPGISTKVSLIECSAGDHLSLNYSDFSCKDVYINACTRIGISSNANKDIPALTVIQSDAHFNLSGSSFSGAVKIIECNIGDEKERIIYNHNFTGVFSEHQSFGWNMRNCAFKEGLTISNCHLAESLDLSGSTVNGLLDLSLSTFHTSTFISNAHFERSTFRGAKFCEAFFLNTEFLGPSDFSTCEFLVPPQFMGATLHQGTTFHGALFPKYSPFSRKEKIPKEQRYEQYLSATLAYRVLKSHMAKIRSQHDEMMFFALEMRTSRQLISWLRNPFSKLLSVAYDWISVYGLSPGRALVALFTWIAGFAILFLILSTTYSLTKSSSFPYTVGIPYDALAIVDPKLADGSVFLTSPIISLVIQNALNPFAIISPKTFILTKSWWILSLSIIQSIGVIAIAALLILAIRSRFQKGSGGGDK